MYHNQDPQVPWGDNRIEMPRYVEPNYGFHPRNDRDEDPAGQWGDRGFPDNDRHRDMDLRSNSNNLRSSDSRFQGRPRDRRGDNRDSFQGGARNNGRGRNHSPDGQRYRSRSRSPVRTGGHEREWDRGKQRQHSSPPPRFDRDDDARARDHDRDERKPFKEDPPSKTVMLRNLPNMCFEAEIRHCLDPQIAAFVDIRVPRNLEGGNRGFGFVEFANMPSACTWMEQVQGAIFMNNQRVVAHFCEDREVLKKRDDREPRQSKALAPQADWECSRCGCNNFRHRNTCFRCEASRAEAEAVTIPSADDQVGLSPCNTLLLRNLDPQTDEAKVAQALLGVLSSVTVKLTKICRDPRTQLSVGYGFVQFKTQHDSTEMYNCLMRVNPPLTIDGKQVSISFAKQPLNEISAPAPNASQQLSSSGGSQRTGYGQGNDVNCAAAVAQMALQQLQKTQMSANIVQQHMFQQPGAGSSSSFRYDPTSGFYFDSNTQMYYDPKTQYFYNPQTQQYLIWNAQTNAYVTVAPGGSVAPVLPVSIEPVSAPVRQEEKPKVESEKEKHAKKVVQEMEKWAKSMNQKQPAQQQKPAAVEVKIGAVASVFQEDDGEEPAAAMEVKRSKISYKSVSIAGPLPVAPNTNGATIAVAKGRATVLEAEDREPSHDGSHSPSNPATPEGNVIARQLAAEEKLVDWDRFACLLCKRQLQSRELLQKHTEMSDLHLRNLDAHRRETMTDTEIAEMEARERDSKYRDRAKERRLKYGEAEPAPPPHQPSFSKPSRSKKRSAPDRNVDRNADEDDDDTAAAPGLGSDNVGAKLMKAMGWSEGRGLGKAKQGIVDPVEARGHSGTAGLGLSEGAPDILPTDTYANKVRKTMRQRFNQMQE